MRLPGVWTGSDYDLAVSCTHKAAFRLYTVQLVVHVMFYQNCTKLYEHTQSVCEINS